MRQVHDSEVRVRLAEAEEALRAIREGEVDALMVDAPDGVHLRSLVDRTWPRRLVRMAIGGMLIAAAGWFGAASLLYRTSVHATITAPLSAVRIPQQGLIYGTPPTVGSMVAAGQQLFEVAPALADTRPLDRLSAESGSLARTIAALVAQIKSLDALEETLESHFSKYQNLRIEHARRLAAEHDALVGSAESRLKSSELELSTQKRLHEKGSVSALELAQSEHGALRSRHELEAARQGGARCRVQLDAATKGVFVGEGDGGQDRVASRQRCDEIVMQRAALAARIGELEARRDEISARLDSETQFNASHERVSVASPIGGVVWSSTVNESSEVSPGTIALEILDPGKLVVEASFNKSDVDQIRPGVRVNARLVGSSEILSGKVVRVLGPGANEQAATGLAARVPTTPDTFRAVIHLDRQPSGGTAANHYHAGRSAVVWTDR